jgi:hypothetical protein
MFFLHLFEILCEQKTPAKHFGIGRKPKSAITRSELLQKAHDAVKISARKIPAPTIPLRTRGMPRKMTDTSNGIISIKGSVRCRFPFNLPFSSHCWDRSDIE